MLTDGGVYDNLGLETAWKRYTTIVVSDGGGQMAPSPSRTGTGRATACGSSLIDNQGGPAEAAADRRPAT